MKNKKSQLIDWVSIFPKLAYEIILFFLNMPRCFYLFFHGLRVTVISYSKLLNGLSQIESSIDTLFKTKLDEQKTTKIFVHFLKEKERLLAEQEKLFVTLFGIFIAVVALFVSMVAILLKN